jgi:hypothetical protein
LVGVNNTTGTWEFSTNNGTNWSAFGTPSVSAARLLASDAATRFRFLPNTNFNGASALTFRAWDQSSGTNGGTANTAGAGTGTSAFSANSADGQIIVTAVNDAPTATNLNTAQAYAKNTPLDLVDIVVGDVDENNKTLTVTLTMSNIAAGSLTTGTSGAVTSTYNPSTGVWSASGAIANLNALLAGVKYVPAADFSGDFTIATTVSDGSASVSGSKIMTWINFLRIATNPSGGFRISGAGHPGLQYDIQFSPSLTSPNWQLLGSAVAAPSGDYFLIDNPAAGTTPRFYRALLH